jgi:hypothetical protein
MKHNEIRTHKLYRLLNAYNDVVKANYNYLQLNSWDKRKVDNGGTAWDISKIKMKDYKKNKKDK